MLLRCGAQATLKEFRRAVKGIADTDVLPEYRLRYEDDSNRALFTSKNTKALLDAFVLGA